MAIKHIWQDIIGSTLGYFRIGKTGPRLKDDTGALIVRDTGDTANVAVTADQFKASGNTGLVINSDSAGSGADWKVSIARPASGMTADWTLTLPSSAGSPNQVLQTNGSGVTTWVDTASGATDITDTTTLTFGATSPVAMFTLPANAVILSTNIIVDTAFDGTANVSLGVAGDTAKYMGAGDNDLQEVAVWQTNPGAIPVGTPEVLIATYADGGATVGSARIVISYSVAS
jgi:hypothetical protein